MPLLDDPPRPPFASSPPAVHAGAILTVDLEAIRHNYRLLRAKLGGRACGGVIKADAYGLGALQVARALQAEGCANFFVAHLDEALTVKPVLAASASIFVLNGLPPGAEADCAAARLIPVINSLEQFAAFRAVAGRLGRSLPVAVQVDSGMSRLGLPSAEAKRLAEDISAFQGLDVRLMMSHLACADEPEHPANRAQLKAFEALRERLPPAPSSLSNSSGIFLGGDYHFDLARPGAALYGVNPTPGEPNPMRAVARLSAKVIQVRETPAGAGVGYGHSFFATTPSRIATISFGYADGWRRLANGASAFYRGHRLPFVGRVSMDSITLDVSTLAPDALAAGALVELIDERQTVDDIARLSGTIGYEVLTSLGRRFHRRYIGA